MTRWGFSNDDSGCWIRRIRPLMPVRYFPAYGSGTGCALSIHAV